MVCECEQENVQVIGLTPALDYVPTPWPELALSSLARSWSLKQLQLLAEWLKPDPFGGQSLAF